MIPETLPRVCLRCGKTFASTGPANRICKKCGPLNAAVREPRCELHVAADEQQNESTGVE